MNGALIRFGEAALEMESHARAALLLLDLSADERADTTALLRHAVGILAIVRKRQNKPTIAPE